MTTTDYRFSIVEGHGLDQGSRLELKDLFDCHYGIWGTSASRPGQRVNMPKRRLDDLLDRREAYVLIARDGEALVGYTGPKGLDGGCAGGDVIRQSKVRIIEDGIEATVFAAAGAATETAGRCVPVGRSAAKDKQPDLARSARHGRDGRSGR